MRTELNFTEKAERELEKLVATYKPRCTPWTEKDSEKVRRYYRRVPLQELARLLSRTTSSVQEHAQILRARGVKLECDK